MPLSNQTTSPANNSSPNTANSRLEKSAFVNDVWLADQLLMSVATIRSQRFRRRHGLDHWLHLDPVMIGSKPRYDRAKAELWLADRGLENAQPPASCEPEV
jgi:hypothetical protein